jgi:excinuclease ABC subunit C
MVQEFYKDKREVPPEILLPHEFENRELLLKALASRCDYRIQSFIPKRGAKFRLLSMAMLNAKHALEHALGQEMSWDIIAASLKQRFGLRQMPRRVECVDISNFQGSDVVGAVVVFFDGAPQKDQYRKYKLEHFESPNDFQAIYEVVYRRLKRASHEGTLPDLFVVDGGKGQLNMALKARDELGLSVDIVGLAKMRTKRQLESSVVSKTPERVYVPGVTSPHLLEHGAPMSRFMARIRDEVHRYVITFHRNRRTKRVFSTELEKISGVSSEMTKRLLSEFKSTEAISEQTPETVARVGRMPLTLARKIVVSLQKKA